MIYTARSGTKVQVAKNIPWASEHQKEIYADRIAQLGDKVWNVAMARKDWAAVRVGDDCIVLPKFTLDRAA